MQISNERRHCLSHATTAYNLDSGPSRATVWRTPHETQESPMLARPQELGRLGLHQSDASVVMLQGGPHGGNGHPGAAHDPDRFITLIRPTQRAAEGSC